MKIDLNTKAYFTWGWDETFFMETSRGNFEFTMTDRNGNGEIKAFRGDYSAWVNFKRHDLGGRGKGRHTIGAFCGKNVKFITS